MHRNSAVHLQKQTRAHLFKFFCEFLNIAINVPNDCDYSAATVLEERIDWQGAGLQRTAHLQAHKHHKRPFKW